MANQTGELSEGYCKEVTWKIPNFFDLSKRVPCNVTSPEFRLANATWYLRLVASRFVSENTIDIGLVRSQSSVSEHRIYHKIGLKTCHGEEYSHSEVTTFVERNRPCVYSPRLRVKFTRQKESLLPNGTLTVCCGMRVMEQATPEASSRPQQHRNEQSQTELKEASSQTEVLESDAEVEEASTRLQALQLDFSELLRSEKDSDLCLKVSHKEFRAHKCILRARSSVFSAMCEKANEEMVIDDLDPDSFPDILQHVYAGRVESLSSKNVSSLYSAADKYDLQDLKSECRDYMRRTLSVDTFCDVMAFALRYQEEELLKLAIEFFARNLREIIATAKWLTFFRDYSTEANKLMVKVLAPGDKNESSCREIARLLLAANKISDS